MCGYKRITLAQLEKAYSKGIVALCNGDRKVVTAGKEEQTMKELFETLQTINVIELHMSVYEYSVTFYAPGYEDKNTTATLTAHTATDLNDAILSMIK